MNHLTDHYDEAYFRGHYRALMMDPVRYRLLAQYWVDVIFRPLRVLRRLDEMKVLDYGCGIGVVSAAIDDAACFDVSAFACDFLRKRGRRVFQNPQEIPRAAFDVVLCSHSLEHYPNPRDVLDAFSQYVRTGGFLLLVLPMETDFTPTITPDTNQHFYAWTFQSITNLLLVSGWLPQHASRIYGPFLLSTLGRVLPARIAVRIAGQLGRIRRGFPSMLVLAGKGPAS